VRQERITSGRGLYAENLIKSLRGLTLIRQPRIPQDKMRQDHVSKKCCGERAFMKIYKIQAP